MDQNIGMMMMRRRFKRNRNGGRNFNHTIIPELFDNKNLGHAVLATKEGDENKTVRHGLSPETSDHSTNFAGKNFSDVGHAVITSQEEVSYRKSIESVTTARSTQNDTNTSNIFMKKLISQLQSWFF
jgi:hypothetical protein